MSEMTSVRAESIFFRIPDLALDLLSKSKKIKRSEDKHMKKVYETPVVDKINFDYENQVVASGGTTCGTVYGWRTPTTETTCHEQHYQENVV